MLNKVRNGGIESLAEATNKKRQPHYDRQPNRRHLQFLSRPMVGSGRVAAEGEEIQDQATKRKNDKSRSCSCNHAITSKPS